MNIAVFEARVLRDDGREMGFDIIVRDETEAKSREVVLAHGRRYLEAKGVSPDALNTEECRFCHAAIASSAVEAEIERIGFAIIEWRNCD